ncbi:MAG TPA: hypothetical protein HA263_07800 [Methanoregulaceae archaeon]|nr:hypothetical protein [Methanoregulaceae archaeon]
MTRYVCNKCNLAAKAPCEFDDHDDPSPDRPLPRGYSWALGDTAEWAICSTDTETQLGYRNDRIRLLEDRVRALEEQRNADLAEIRGAFGAVQAALIKHEPRPNDRRLRTLFGDKRMINTILNELRTELATANHTPVWRNATEHAIEIIETVAAAQPKTGGMANPDAPPREPSIRIEIPIAYISSISIDDAVGPEIYFDPDACPKNWDAASLPVPLATAIRAAEMLEAARENPARPHHHRPADRRPQTRQR